MTRLAETQHCVNNIAPPQIQPLPLRGGKGLQVAALLGSGLTNQEIADRVGCSLRYVQDVRREGPPQPKDRQADRIRALLAQGYGHHSIVSLTGFSDIYIRAVRSRHNRRLGLTAPGMRLRSPQRPRRDRGSYRPNPTGQPRAELRELAETLYRWRQEGRYDQ